MYIKYGAYQHAPGEANLISFIVRPRRSGSFQVANVVEAHVSGTLKVEVGEDQYDLATKIQTLDDSLQDGFDFGLYHDNNTPTPHFMSNSDSYNMTGNQIVHRSFPANHNGEFSTGRDFAYAVRAEYQASNSMIMEYQETITHQGDTGPRIAWTESRYHAPTYHVTSFSSISTVTQTGHAVTLGTYLLPPPPYLPPPFYLPAETIISRTGPRRYPQGFEGFRISWQYTYKTPVIAPIFPGIR